MAQRSLKLRNVFNPFEAWPGRRWMVTHVWSPGLALQFPIPWAPGFSGEFFGYGPFWRLQKSLTAALLEENQNIKHGYHLRFGMHRIRLRGWYSEAKGACTNSYEFEWRKPSDWNRWLAFRDFRDAHTLNPSPFGTSGLKMPREDEDES